MVFTRYLKEVAGTGYGKAHNQLQLMVGSVIKEKGCTDKRPKVV